MESVGVGEKSPRPRSRHGKRPVRVTDTPGHAHRADIPIALVKLPDTPVMVTVTVPVVAEPLAVSVNVLLLAVLLLAVLLGLNDAVTPPGRPDADKLTLPLKPFCGVTVITLVLLVPCVIVKLLGEAERA